jgi:hypothetical protein
MNKEDVLPFGLFVVMLMLLISALIQALEKRELQECNTWASTSKTQYVTTFANWQIDQCNNYNINLK